MTDKPKLVPYADITATSGTYEKDGKTRNRYTKIGVLFASQGAVKALEGHRLSIKLDALPNGGEGWLNVFPKERKETGETDTVVDVSDEPINLDNIPF